MWNLQLVVGVLTGATLPAGALLSGCGGVGTVPLAPVTRYNLIDQWPVANVCGVATAGGNIYVGQYGESSTDSSVFKYSDSGKQLTQSPEGILAGTGIAVDSAQNLYIGNDGNHHGLTKISSIGKVLWTVGGITASGPTGVIVDPLQNVWIVDNESSKLVEVNANGGVIGSITTSPTFGLHHDGEPNNDYIAIDSKGVIYLADAPNSRVLVFSPPSVTAVASWSTNVPGDNLVSTPSGIALDGKGFVFIADNYNDRILKFTTGGKFVLEWGSSGSGPGQFNGPLGVAANASGFVFVTDTGNQRVQVFAPRA